MNNEYTIIDLTLTDSTKSHIFKLEKTLENDGIPIFGCGIFQFHQFF